MENQWHLTLEAEGRRCSSGRDGDALRRAGAGTGRRPLHAALVASWTTTCTWSWPATGSAPVGWCAPSTSLCVPSPRPPSRRGGRHAGGEPLPYGETGRLRAQAAITPRSPGASRPPDRLFVFSTWSAPGWREAWGSQWLRSFPGSVWSRPCPRWAAPSGNRPRGRPAVARRWGGRHRQSGGRGPGRGTGPRHQPPGSGDGAGGGGRPGSLRRHRHP